MVPNPFDIIFELGFLCLPNLLPYENQAMLRPVMLGLMVSVKVCSMPETSSLISANA